MGVDFISGKAKSFIKGWDREAAALACPDLLREQPKGEPRLVQGDVRPGAAVEVGDVLIVRLTDEGLVGFRRDAVVVTFPSPPQEIVDAVREGCGVATGTVEQVGVLSGTVRVSLK